MRSFSKHSAADSTGPFSYFPSGLVARMRKHGPKGKHGELAKLEPGA